MLFQKLLTTKSAIAASLGALLVSIVACGGGSSTYDEDNESEESGLLWIALTDAPIDDATEVVVKFDAIEVKPQQGNSISFSFDQPKSIDLLSLQNGETAALLEGQSLDAGQYNWMRLMVDASEGELDSYISFADGSTYSLYIPSGSESGLKLNRSFMIPAGGSANFTIDFDLRKSIVNPGNNSDDYKLKPVLRIEDNTQVGSIEGYIVPSLLTSETCDEGLAVYVYSGFGGIIDDEGSENSPLTSSLPEYDGDNDRYTYKLSFLTEGDYTVAVTCDAENDDPETDEDESSWSALLIAETSVVANESSQLNFE